MKGCVCVSVCASLFVSEVCCLWIGMCVCVGGFLHVLVQHALQYALSLLLSAYVRYSKYRNIVCDILFVLLFAYDTVFSPMKSLCTFVPFWNFIVRSKDTHILRCFSENEERWWFTSVDLFILLLRQSGNTTWSVPLCIQAVLHLWLFPLHIEIKGEIRQFSF